MKGGNIIIISFCKSRIKAARLETLEAFLHCGCAQTDFSVLTALYSILEVWDAVCRDLDCSCESLQTFANHASLGPVFTTMKNEKLLFQLTLLVAAFFWDTYDSGVPAVMPLEFTWVALQSVSCHSSNLTVKALFLSLQTHFNPGSATLVLQHSTWALADSSLLHCTVITNSHSTGHSLPHVRQGVQRGNHGISQPGH